MNLFALHRPAFVPRLQAAAPWTWAPEKRRRVALAWLRALAIAVGVVLLLWGLLWLAVPPLLKSQLQQRLGDLLGRPVTVGSVQFAPWSLQLTLRDFTIGPAPTAVAGSAPLLHVDRIHADADWSSLFRFAPVIEALQIDAPQVHVARTGPERFDYSDIIDRINASIKPQAETKPPMRFALYNMQLRDGAVIFDDKPFGQRHEVKALLLTLPFLSSLPSQVEVAVEPRLAFTFDGTAFDSGAQSTPFAKDRETALTLKMGDFDLTIAKPYLPRDLPVDLQRGRAQADLSLHFELRPDNSAAASLRGNVKVSDLALADRTGAPLAAWQSLQVALADVQPLERKVSLGTVRIDGLDVALTRDAQGRINVLQLAPPHTAGAPSAEAGASQRQADAQAATTPPASQWQLSVKSFELGGARVRWNDAATEPDVALSLDGIESTVGPIVWPSTEPASLALKAQLHAAGNEAAVATLDVQGSADPTKANVALRVGDVDFTAFAPYVAPLFKPRVEGRAVLDAKVDWAKDPQALVVQLASASIDGLRVIDAAPPERGSAKTPEAPTKSRAAPPKSRAAPAKSREALTKSRDAVVKPRDPLTWKRFEVADVRLDVLGQKLAIGRVGLHEPQVMLVRAQDGSLNVAKWVNRPAAASASADTSPRSAAAPAAAASSPWQVTLGQFTLDGAQVTWRDEAAPGSSAQDPVQLDVHGLRTSVQGLSWPVAQTQAQVELAAQIVDPAAKGDPRARGGSIDWKGRVVASPLAVRGALRIERFPMHALDRYANAGYGASLQRGQLQWRGDVALRQRSAGIEANVAGDLLLADLHVFAADPDTRALSSDELIGWQALNVRGLKVALAPQARPRVDIDEAVLSDFYSQLVLNEEGRFNVRDAARKGAPATPPGGFAVGRQISEQSADEKKAEDARKAEEARKADEAKKAESESAVAAGPAASASAPRAKLPVDVGVGGVQLVNGRVDYTDRLIKPNFSAALSEVNGKLGAFRSDSPDMATIELTGRIAGTGLLDVRGSLNPMANPLALDVGTKATEIELAPLSPYAGKYAGYAIERGKLSMDLHYNVQPDGRLQATNHVILNQLTFGDHIDSPSATKLPVKLAVALLSDRHGVIDVNLPVNGSINDPKFSVGGIIVQVIVNLITKIVTAPFSWMAGGGSGPDPSVVSFKPGTSVMAADATAALDQVAKALQERPSLQMTVTGAADPLSEGDAIRDAMLQQRLTAQRRNEGLRAGVAASAPVEALTPEEHERLLRAVYRDTELPDKPRNAIGLTKDIPAPEMEALLKKSMRVSEDTARQLALQRGLAVRDALVAKGLPSERMFLAAPKLHVSGEDDAAWTPRAQLSLAVK